MRRARGLADDLTRTPPLARSGSNHEMYEVRMVSKRRARDSLLSQYFSEIRRYPLLSKEEEKNLARDIQKGN